jgi:biotin-(acetyl-CoA carboxylase) ligase
MRRDERKQEMIYAHAGLRGMKLAAAVGGTDAAHLPCGSSGRTTAPHRGLGRVPLVRYDDDVEKATRDAKALARSGGPEGSIALVESRVVGRGRFGRPLKVGAGDRLVCAIVLRPPRSLADLDILRSVAVSAVARAVEAMTLATVSSSGDGLYIGGLRVGGVSVEAGDEDAYVIVSVGVNVATEYEALPAALTSTLTSLRASTGRRVDRVELLAHVLVGLQRDYRGLLTEAGTMHEPGVQKTSWTSVRMAKL